MQDKEFSFEITKSFGVISTSDRGWTKELNLVSWRGAPPKYDIRDWDENHERMSRGITLREEEIEKLVDLYLSSKG